jgi:hypothetical protein
MKARWIAIACFGAAALAGCVEREMKITSEPTGALVFVSDREVGRTPVTLPFTWYGDYEVLLRLEGHQTLRANAPINPPWYEVPPLDLFSQMAPWTYQDRRGRASLAAVPPDVSVHVAEQLVHRLAR